MREAMLISRLEARLILRAYFPFLLLIVMPVIVISFVSRGVVGGPAHTVPSLAAMFGLFGMTLVGLAFFRDHGWHTWDRLRASPLHARQIMLGKALPLVVLFFVQQIILLFVGWAFFGMPWRGDLAAAALLILAIVAVEVSFGMLVVTFCRTVEQIAVAGYLSALLMVGFGGALAPLSRLPGWAVALAPVSPVYWMEKGFRVLVVGDRPTGDLLVSVGVLFGFATVAALLAVRCYRFDEQKSYFPQ